MTRELVLPDYKLSEELISAISHGVGTGLSIAACVLCVIKAVHDSVGVVGITAAAVFGAAMIVLYCMSTLYHSITARKAKYVLRVIDHCSVFLLIAGTYTPFLLVSLSGRLGWMFFYIIWGLTIIGIILNAIDLRRFSKVSAYINVAMGWLIIFSFRSLVKAVDRQGIILLLAGGIIYSIGAILYGLGSKVRYMHSVWHFFVLGGTICHFFSIYLAVL
ncbi:MAG: hemolysin III family protein [Lachnospiraceae bacterium]|nr:hemolysin III family protein [Lachnospiraceae bacterium]